MVGWGVEGGAGGGYGGVDVGGGSCFYAADFGFVAVQRSVCGGGDVVESLYVGLMLVIFWPPVALTNSLLMNRPVGRVIFLPFGAVRSTLRSGILEAVIIETQRWKAGLVIGAAIKVIERRARKGVKRAEESTTFMGMR